MSKVIPLEKAQPGNIVDEEVIDNKGQTIVAQGKQLTAIMLERLKRMGIQEISIIANDSEEISQLTEKDEHKQISLSAFSDEEDRATILTQGILKRFAPHRSNRSMEDLKKAVLLFVPRLAASPQPWISIDNADIYENYTEKHQ